MTGYSMPSGRYERGGDYDISPKGEHGWHMIRLAVVVAVLTSSAWAWMLNEERAAHRQQITEERVVSERLLADAVARMTPIKSLTISYSNGARAIVNMKEIQP